MNPPGTTHLTQGLLWFAGGCTITFLTFSAAASRGGGMYLVASGAIFFGLLQFLYGAFLYVVGKNRSQHTWPVTSRLGVTDIPVEKLIGNEPAQRESLGPNSEQANRWNALVKYDADIAAAAEKLRPYGERWVAGLGRDFFALDHDKKYLPNITRKLIDDAEQERAQRWVSAFQQTSSGERCTEESLSVLRQAEAHGYVLSIQDNKTIVARKGGRGTSYLRSNSDIRRFGQHL